MQETQPCIFVRWCSIALLRPLPPRTRVTRVLDNLVPHYEPDKSFHPVTDTSFYRDDLSRLGIARLTVVRFEAKFKLAQGRSPESKKALSQFLEQRNLPMDATAFDEMHKAWTNL